MLSLAEAHSLRCVRPFVCRQVACMSSYEIRKKFIEFYKDHHTHEFIPSSPVRISGDTSLMFVNAGMNQFKPKFLGTNDPHDWLSPLKRAVNSQKCIRVGGKHNDLDDVGKDTSHHTFFEMLGSWSFGDYFKTEACEMALELLTDRYGLSIDQLYFTYFAGDRTVQADVNTRDIWRSLGVPKSRIIPFSAKDNFWEMGDNGPCGPCTEIHFDYSKEARNVPELVNTNNPEVVEIWNLVFMQFNRLYDQSLVELPTHHVDTGMGFERLTAILQKKKSNYDTDLFQPLLKEIELICPDSPKYKGGSSHVDQAYRTIADHVRMLVIAIGDKVYPGNTKEELIVRQVLRRAYLQSKNHLNAPDYLLKALSTIVISSLGSHFTYLPDKQAEIMNVIHQEVSSFSEMLSKGENIFLSTIAKIENTNFPVETAILMHNHFGYPIEMLVEATRKHNLSLDIVKFREYQEFRRLSKVKHKEELQGIKPILIRSDVIDYFRNSGLPVTNSNAKYDYSKLNNGYIFPTIRSKLINIVNSDGMTVLETTDNERYALVFEETCFYHTEGGQDCDIGEIASRHDNRFIVDEVVNCGGYVFHHGSGGRFKVGDICDLTIDHQKRVGCMRAHTATHLLNHALREVLGEVSQHGSRVSSDEMRFTFLGTTPTHNDLRKVGNLVMSHINADRQVHGGVSSLTDALANHNVRRLDDYMYTDPVRIISIGSSANNSHSIELCGGTHVLSTGDIENFEILTSKSQGKHKTTVQCLTSTLATECKQLSHELQKLVEENVLISDKVLSSSGSSIHDCMVVRKEIGRVNYKVNQSEISVVMKAELKEKLRKHSQMLGTKIRNIKKGQMDESSMAN